jgi:cell division protein FtsB
MDAAPTRRPAGTRGGLARAVPPRLQGVRIPGLAIATVLLLVFAVLSLAPALSTYLATRQQVSDAAAAVHRQEQDLARLDAEKARWSDPAYIRSQAGSRLFYVLPGEITYRVVGGTARPTADSPRTPTKSLQATKTDWARALLDSVVAAGTTDAPPPALSGTTGG